MMNALIAEGGKGAFQCWTKYPHAEGVHGQQA